MLAALLAAQPIGQTLATWTDTVEVGADSTVAATVVARPLQCTGGTALSKDVTWAAFTNHPADGVGFYTVRVNGISVVPVKDDDTYRITVGLGLVTALLPVSVRVTVWNGSGWAQTSEITLGRSLLGLSLGFTCPDAAGG